MVRRFVEEDTVLRAYVVASVGRDHDAKDILQTVWRVLWEKSELYDESRPLRAWAMGIARLEVLKWRQRQARSRESLSGDALERLEECALEHSEELDARVEFLEECLHAIPFLWQRILAYKYYDDLSIRDIAGRVTRSIGAVEMILVRARRGLKDCMEKKARADSKVG